MNWKRDGWQGFYAERAAIAEYDGGVSRQTAEAVARGACIREWMERHQGTYNEAREALAGFGIT